MILTVVDKFLTALQTQLDEKRVQLQVDDDARNWLVEEGYDPHMGARPMERVIQESEQAESPAVNTTVIPSIII